MFRWSIYNLNDDFDVKGYSLFLNMDMNLKFNAFKSLRIG
jgi:hypothetical protein